METVLTRSYLGQGADRWRPWDHTGKETGRKEASRWERAKTGSEEAPVAGALR